MESPPVADGPPRGPVSGPCTTAPAPKPVGPVAPVGPPDGPVAPKPVGPVAPTPVGPVGPVGPGTTAVAPVSVTLRFHGSPAPAEVIPMSRLSVVLLNDSLKEAS